MNTTKVKIHVVSAWDPTAGPYVGYIDVPTEHLSLMDYIPDQVFQLGNINHPADWAQPSCSVRDVISWHIDGEGTHMIQSVKVMSVGFAPLDPFQVDDFRAIMNAFARLDAEYAHNLAHADIRKEALLQQLVAARLEESSHPDVAATAKELKSLLEEE